MSKKLDYNAVEHLDYNVVVDNFIEEQKQKFIMELLNTSSLKDLTAHKINRITGEAVQRMLQTFQYAYEYGAERSKKF